MPRNISFMLTQDQVRNRTKTVTRRQGWKFVKVGDILHGVEKSQGLKKGEKINRLCRIRVTGKRRERLDAITKGDCSLEGFPEMEPADFIAFYGKHNKCAGSDLVTRIEFEYLD